MATGNRLLIMVLAAIILCGAGAAFMLEWAGKPGGAMFTALATTALGVLCPSPLRQAGTGGVPEGSGDAANRG